MINNNNNKNSQIQTLLFFSDYMNILGWIIVVRFNLLFLYRNMFPSFIFALHTFRPSSFVASIYIR